MKKKQRYKVNDIDFILNEIKKEFERKDYKRFNFTVNMEVDSIATIEYDTKSYFIKEVK